MNPIAALLASLTGAAPGQAGDTSTGETNSGMFAGLLAALGTGAGEAGLAGAPGTLLPLGNGGLPGTPQSLLLSLDGEDGALSIAPLQTTTQHIDEVSASAGAGASQRLMEGLLANAGGDGDALQADAQSQAPTAGTGGEATSETGAILPGVAAEGGLPIASGGHIKEDAKGDDAPGEDDLQALSLLFAGEAPSPQAPSQETPAVQQTSATAGPAPGASAGLAASGAILPDTGRAPKTAPADTTAPAPVSGVAAPAAGGPATTPTNGPSLPLPSQQAMPGDATTLPPGSAAQNGASATAGEAHDAPTGKMQAFNADPNGSLEASADIAPSEGASRSQPIGKSPLDVLLQHAQHHQGGEPVKAPPAAGAADMNVAPQQARAAAPAATPLPQVPVAAVAVHIAQQIHAGAKRFEIRLDPPELGRVEVRLDVTREGHATTHLVVERSETLDMLQRDARQLERALQNAGLDTSKGDLTFSLKDQGHAHDRNGDGEQRRGASEPVTGSEPLEESWHPLPGTRLGDAGLDIRI